MELSLSGLLAHLLPLGCVVAASFLQSLTGFGLAIVLAPLLMFFYDAKEVVSLVLLICVTGNLVQGPACSLALSSGSRWEPGFSLPSPVTR